MTGRYIAATGRASFKRDGHHGALFTVVDTVRKVQVAKVGSAAEAAALAAHLNDGGALPTTRAELAKVAAKRRAEISESELRLLDGNR